MVSTSLAATMPPPRLVGHRETLAGMARRLQLVHQRHGQVGCADAARLRLVHEPA